MVFLHDNEDIFTSTCDYIVNPVNCVGVMGKGLALEFKKRYPQMFKDYVDRCNKKLVKPGEPYVYENIINFPTKNHWKFPSKLEWVLDGLSLIKKNFNNCSIAIPPLGCGCGGLDRASVAKKMLEMFSNATIDLHIYIK